MLALDVAQGQRCTLSLASHYERARDVAGDRRLVIVFDIDGTILDTRYGLLKLLSDYDREQKTGYFSEVRREDLGPVRETLSEWLNEQDLPPHVRAGVRDTVRSRWSRLGVLESHRPFRGVLEVIRWFQLQPNTEVVLNTGRPERLRAWTLETLAALGREHRVAFSSEQLFMRAPNRNARQAKIDTLRYLRSRGDHVFAIVDDRVANLEAFAREDPEEEALLLHADTIFSGAEGSGEFPSLRRRRRGSRRTVRLDGYCLEHLVSEQSLPRRVELTWNGSLEDFLASEVSRYELRLEEDLAPLEEAAGACVARGRNLLLDLTRCELDWERLGQAMETLGLGQTQVWLQGSVDQVEALGALAGRVPGSLVQCVLSSELVSGEPRQQRRALSELRRAGVSRIALPAASKGAGPLIGRLERAGFRVHLSGVRGLQAFLRGVLLMPSSLSSAFPF